MMKNAQDQKKRALLSGIKVLDFTQALAGPFCTRLLHDLGAEIIKVEPPGFGDGARYAPFVKKGYSGYFMQNNCGKQSIAVNLKHPEGVKIVKELVKLCDVVVENFKPGTMERLGLDYDNLQKLKSDIIMCSISGYGQYGPWAELPGFAATAHALSGLMWVTGKNDNPDNPPMAPGAAFGDTGAGMHAATAICAALFSKERTGEGEYIDVSLLDCLFDQLDSAVEIFVLSDGKESRAMLSPVYQGRDGWATIAIGAKDSQWQKLTEAMERPDLLKDPRFHPVENRVKNLEVAEKILNDWLYSFEHLDDALKKLELAGIPSARILSIPEALEHPQLKAREMMVEIDHPVLGKVPVVNSPFRLKNGTAGLRGLPPELGEHSKEILSGYLGYSAENIAGLEKDGVISQNNPGG